MSYLLIPTTPKYLIDTQYSNNLWHFTGISDIHILTHSVILSVFYCLYVIQHYTLMECLFIVDDPVQIVTYMQNTERILRVLQWSRLKSLVLKII
jgi:hypothetical protein